jgi:phage/plasmid primase-like uncharacterized protein
METPSSLAARSGKASFSGLKTRASPASSEDRLVAVEGLVGALVEALAYGAPALQDCRAGNLLPVASSAL